MAEVEVRGLADREQEVLAHVVKDPAGWWNHAVTYWAAKDNSVDSLGRSVPEQHLAAKVARHGADYDARKDDADYKTCAVCAAEKEAARVAEMTAQREASAAARAEGEAEIDTLKARVAALEAAQ